MLDVNILIGGLNAGAKRGDLLEVVLLAPAAFAEMCHWCETVILTIVASEFFRIPTSGRGSSVIRRGSSLIFFHTCNGKV